MKKIALPAFDVGCASEPDRRYRLVTVEAWEAANEKVPDDAQQAAPDVPVRPGMPARWGGVDYLGAKGSKRAKK